MDQFFGAGRYRHVKRKGEEGELRLFGSWDVQAEDDGTLLVTTTYPKSETQAAVVQGFRWTRIEGSRG